MIKSIVTGGAGFIGSHTSLLLLQRGYDVIIYDSFVNSSYKVIMVKINTHIFPEFFIAIRTLIAPSYS